MNQAITVEMIDGELGVVFPDEVVKKLNLAEGDTLRVVEEAYGLVLTRPDAVSDGAVGAYRRGAESTGQRSEKPPRRVAATSYAFGAA